jgi:hypothetical protein
VPPSDRSRGRAGALGAAFPSASILESRAFFGVMRYTGSMSSRTRKEPRHFRINVEFEGKTYEASYSVSSGTVYVNSWYGSTSRELGDMSEQIARILFCELLQIAKSRGQI